MFYLSRAVINTDLYTKVLCILSSVCFVQTSSVTIYNINCRRLIYAKKIEFFDVIKSAAVVGDQILIVFNGYLVFLDKDLNERIRHRFGRCSIDYRQVGAYIAHGRNSICLASFFGSMVFYSFEDRLESPIEHFADENTILDLKAIEGTKRYLLLVRNLNGVFARIYEHKPEMIKMLREINVPGGYIAVPLKDSFAVFSPDRVFFFKDGDEIEVYKISQGLSGDLTLIKADAGHECKDISEVKLFTCYTSHCDKGCSLMLIANEEGELFSLKCTEMLKLEYIGRINPSKDIEMHSSGFLVSVGYNSDNCVYFIMKEGEVWSLELVDAIETIKGLSTSAITFDGLHHVYVSDGHYIGEIAEKEPFHLLNEVRLFEEGKEKEVRGVFSCRKSMCIQYDDEVHCFILEGEKMANLYRFTAKDEIIGYFRVGKDDFYMMAGLVMICNNENGSVVAIKEHRIDYDVFSGNSQHVFVGYRNRITRLDSSSSEDIEIGFVVKEMETSERYLFILTGKRVLRVYGIEDRRFVFIQSFRFDVMFLSLFNGFLYTIGTEIHRFKINEDGSLSLPIRIREYGQPIGKKEGVVIFEEKVVDLGRERILDIDGWKSVFLGDKVVIADGCGLKIYGYKKHRVFATDVMSGKGEYKIIGREAVYIDNNSDGFKIKRFDGSLVVEGCGNAIEFSSSEYQIVSAYARIYDKEGAKSKYFLKVYKNGGLLYDFEIFGKIEVITVNGKEVYCSIENNLYCYEIGVKTLLKKFKVALPSRITKMCTGEDRLFVGTEKNSVFVVKDRRIVCRERIPRHVMALESMDDGCLVVGERVGNVVIMKIKDDSLVSVATIFINDMPIQFVSQDKVFGICTSGKVIEIIKIDEELFEFLEQIGQKISEALNKPFFQPFRRNRFISSEYIREFVNLSEQQVKNVQLKTGIDVEKMLEVISTI
ncbi:DNA damage-binding protein 1 [Encephalitozoon hellem]|uniref:DNA damage-binding protein 1 n=1 Tax=Encephalitozoon hellem TaxID=27973 RepID=A0ABY8CJS7_ENCHE|nr:DNA damage-binding protein 1 [Encephalitozoon hellem]